MVDAFMYPIPLRMKVSTFKNIDEPAYSESSSRSISLFSLWDLRQKVESSVVMASRITNILNKVVSMATSKIKKNQITKNKSSDIDNPVWLRFNLAIKAKSNINIYLYNAQLAVNIIYLLLPNLKI